MTVATKSGAVILKSGSVAQGCGCCDPCAPELDALPDRFEVDISASAMADLYCFSSFTWWWFANTFFDPFNGYSDTIYSPTTTSGTKTLFLTSTVSGVATYNYTSPDLVLSITASPATGGKYACVLQIIPSRFFVKIIGDLVRFDGDGIPNMFRLGSDFQYVPAAETLANMQSEASTLTTTPTVVGQEYVGPGGAIPRRFGGTGYEWKSAFNAVAFDMRLSCPDPSLIGQLTGKHCRNISAAAVPTSSESGITDNTFPVTLSFTDWATTRYAPTEYYMVDSERTFIPSRLVNNQSRSLFSALQTLSANFSFPQGATLVISSQVGNSGGTFRERVSYNARSRSVTINQVRAIFSDSSVKMW